jgi:biotin carboxyl carrier protein
MEYRVTVGEREETIDIVLEGECYRVRYGETEHMVDARRFEPGHVLSLIIGSRYREAEVVATERGYDVHLVSGSFEVTVEHELVARAGHSRQRQTGADGETVRSTMPGIVIDVKVAAGDQVESGQAVVVIEAMKMQNELTTRSNGVVRQVHVAPGDTVTSGQELITVDGAAPP